MSDREDILPESILKELARTLSRGRSRSGAAGFRRAQVGARDAAPTLFDEPRSGEAHSGGIQPVERERASEDPIAAGAIRARRSPRVAVHDERETTSDERRLSSGAGSAPRLPFFEPEGRVGPPPDNDVGVLTPPQRTTDDGALSPPQRAAYDSVRRPRWRRHPALAGGGAFETFVADEENLLAYRAVLESAHRPGVLARLVFLHGARGTGKTHLLRACEAVLFSRGKRVVYRAAEKLTQEFTSALIEHRAGELFEALSGGDVLLLDEVHRFGQRRATRAFVARLLLRYVESGRLVLLASRYHARQVHGLEERQVSLFLSGFSVQVRPPAEATKERWLRQRHRLLTGEDPPREIHRLSRAVRGGLGDLAEAHDRFLVGAEVEELAGMFGSGMPSVVEETAARLEVEAAALGQRASSRALSRARDIASHVALRLGYRAEIVGRHLGGRKAQTVRAAARRVASALGRDLDLRSAVESILMRLSG